MSGGNRCRYAWALAVVGCVLTATLPVSTARAQEETTSGQNRNETRKEQPASDKRYALVKSGDDILRIDREAGSVSFCRKANDIWRCMPAPLAEDAYQAEIASLADEVDRLTARLQELEAVKVPSDGGAAAIAPDAPEAITPPDEGSKESISPGDGPATSGGKTDRAPKRLSDEDEKQLEEMLQFSEKAMRRFFGLMKDLRDELEQSDGG